MSADVLSFYQQRIANESWLRTATERLSLHSCQVLERVTRQGSRAIRTLLTDLGDMIDREGVASPAIIVVGEVVLKSDAQDRLRAFAKQAEQLA